MLDLFRRRGSKDLTRSILLDNQTFYPAFMRDLDRCKRELIIECPFITHKRMNALYPSFRRLTKRGVRVVVNTRDPSEHEPRMAVEADEAILALQNIGVLVLLTDRHHRKIAIVDGEVLYEGSLNILSQNDSCEVMRRIESSELAQDMLSFIKIEKFLRG